MIVIKRPRVSGKTTILLHYMVLDQNSIYVAGTEDYAKRAFKKSQELGLEISEHRFVGVTNPDLKNLRDRGNKILVDDIDYIIKRHPDIGYKIVALAYAITILKGD